MAKTREDSGKIEDKIRELNKTLKRVSVRKKGDRLFLRATLPDKETGKQRQCEFKTGAPATLAGLRAAKVKADKLSSDLILGIFKWDDWVYPEKTLDTGDTCQDWVERLEKDHWDRVERTKSRERSFREDYLNPYSKLPQNARLTADLLLETLLKVTEPAKGKTRNRYCLAFNRLADFAELGVNFNRYRVNYDPKERYLPTDEEIRDTVDRIANPAWQWIAGLMAAYGLRPHELFHLDLSLMDGSIPILKVLPNTKTKNRTVLPCPLEWVDRWGLRIKRWPNFQASPNTHDNKDLGARITPGLKRNCVNWTGYAFRDCYVIRLEKNGWPPNLAGIMGGHSQETRRRHYLNRISVQDLIDTFKRLN